MFKWIEKNGASILILSGAFMCVCAGISFSNTPKKLRPINAGLINMEAMIYETNRNVNAANKRINMLSGIEEQRIRYEKTGNMDCGYVVYLVEK